MPFEDGTPWSEEEAQRRANPWIMPGVPGLTYGPPISLTFGASSVAETPEQVAQRVERARLSASIRESARREQRIRRLAKELFMDGMRRWWRPSPEKLAAQAFAYAEAFQRERERRRSA